MRNNRGFTLLEIIIALAVVGSLLVTLIYTLNHHLGIAERHESVTVASLLAKNKMAEMEEKPEPSTGTFPEPYSGYGYATLVNASLFAGLSEVSVKVIRGSESIKLTELIRSR
ncbi:MAG: type II secretion system protein [Thermodesulfovibrionales bacterium]|nr:type II secretion system protein [Thermodesulfovibrionales bacterium]